jgi:REP element-mobilizing transposase RayT
MIGQTISHIIVKSENPIIKKRKPLRLKEYDYLLDGSYFVTICTKGRENLFGIIIDSTMSENEFGVIVRSCWNDLPGHYKNISLDEFVVMPNHVHGIIIIDNPVGVIHESPLQMNKLARRQMLLPKIVGRFKQNTAKQINIMRGTYGETVWQRNYYEHIIRNERSLYKIREYIRTNPVRWTWDKENTLYQDTDEFDRWLNEKGKQKIKSRKIL